MASDFFDGPSEGQPGLPLPGTQRKPVLTWTLIGINVLVWVAMEAAGGSEDPGVLLDFGAMFGPLIASGEYWRLFTAMFLHVGGLHLLFNGIGLLIFGQLVERVYGPVRFILIYILAGLSGSVSSYLFNSVAIGAGASGAIFGVLGALAAFFIARRDLPGQMRRQNLTSLLVIAGINLFYGLTTPGIDNWAHMGGFVAGIAIGLVYAPQYKVLADSFGTVGRVDTNPAIRRWWVVPATGAVLLAGTWLGTSTLPDNPASRVHTAERYLQQESYAEALDEVSQAIRLDPSYGQAYYMRGRILAELGEIQGARLEVTRAIRMGGLDAQTRQEAIALLVALGSRR